MVMSKILIIYSTTDGQTLKISRKLQILLEDWGHRVELVSVDLASGVDLQVFDKIVIGAGIRYGRHCQLIHEFIENRRALLDSKPNAFFSVNAVARKPEKSTPETNPYLRKFLGRISWRPKQLAVFAGKIDYQRYKAIDRAMIRLIMWMTKGPTDPYTVVEFTDWSKVEAFAVLLDDM